MASEVSRRSFLSAVGSTSAVTAGTIATPSTLAALSTSLETGEDYWERVRQQFSFGEDKVPMNAANLCPSPRLVQDRVGELSHDIHVDCSLQNRAKFNELLEVSRRRVARQLGVSSDEIALVRNTSEANNIINNGLDLEQGDEVLLWDQNHPTNNVAWEVRAARFGIQVTKVSTPPSPSGVEELVSVFKTAFSHRTRVLAISHVSNVSGLRLPVRELCQEAHGRGIYVHVDGAQTWGASNLDLSELGCDSFAASSHKWFLGPREVGLLYVREERIAEIWPNIVAGAALPGAPAWGSDEETDLKGARKFESMGQRNDAGLAAVASTADFLDSIGLARVESRVHELAARLKESLASMGLELVTPMERKLSGGVVIVSVPGRVRGEVFERLYAGHGIAGAPTGGIRLCPHIYNTIGHVDRAVQGLRDLRRLFTCVRAPRPKTTHRKSMKRRLSFRCWWE